MNRVTGSKVSQDIAASSILSIRLSPDGLYFGIISPRNKVLASGSHKFISGIMTGLEEAFSTYPFLIYLYKHVNLSVDTNRAALFPAAEQDMEPEEVVAWCGIKKDDQHVVVRCPDCNDIGTAILLDGDALEYLNKTYGERLVITHPLLTIADKAPAKAVIRLRYTSAFVHIAVFDKTLLRTEILPYKLDEDVVFYLRNITEAYPSVKRFKIMISGDDAKLHKRKLAHYVPSCAVDKNTSDICV